MKRVGARRLLKVTRRGFLKMAGGVALAGTAGAAFEATLLEPRWIKLTKPVVGLANLPAAWDGVRMALLTDIHLGPLVKLGYVEKVVAMANRARPDLVVLTGDFVSRRSAIKTDYGAVLGKLRAREGKFAVLGNHDHWTDPAGVAAMLAAAGVRILTNRRCTLERSGQKLCLAGVDDLWEGRPDLHAALNGVSERVPRILLCHNPDYAERMPPEPRVDLMLSGHTHGGQIRFPLFGRPWLPIRYDKYAAGLAQGPRCPVYTSCGLGMVGVPIRLNCRPELTILTLRRA